MPTPSPPSDLPSHAFPTIASFTTFLDREHTTAPGIYLKLAKKTSGIPSITWAEAVEVALCYGWIDGRANSIDANWWSSRFTPRRAKSIWSQKNVNTVARLIKDGRMRPAGLAAVDAAKADGRWERAYAGSATMVVPEDFKAALAEESAAEACFESLSKGEKFGVLMPLAKVVEKNRAKKIEALVQMLAVGRVVGVKKEKVEKRVSKGKTEAKKREGVKKEPVVKRAKRVKDVVPQAKSERVDEEKPKVQSRRDGLRRRT